MGTLRCVMCEQPVLGGPRWEARLCSRTCATEALFEAVRLEERLERSEPTAGNEAGDGDDSRNTALQLLDDFQVLYRRQLLMRATVAWDELGELETPGGIPMPDPAADAEGHDAAVAHDQ